MKRIILLLLILLLCPYVDARMTATMAGGSGGAAASVTNYCDDANCQGCWYLNGTTTEADQSGNSYTLTNSTTAPSQSSTVPSGYSGNSRSFVYANGTYLDIADGSAANLDINGANANISIVAWVQVTSNPNGNYTCVVSKFATDNKQYRLGIYGTGSNAWRIHGQVAAASDDCANVDNAPGKTTNLGINAWHHIAMVYNDTDVRIYLDGQADNPSDTPVSKTDGICNGSGGFTIGAESAAGGNNFNGLIDEVAVFDRALSSTEVAAIYANGLSGNKGGSD